MVQRKTGWNMGLEYVSLQMEVYMKEYLWTISLRAKASWLILKEIFIKECLNSIRKMGRANIGIKIIIMLECGITIWKMEKEVCIIITVWAVIMEILRRIYFMVRASLYSIIIVIPKLLIFYITVCFIVEKNMVMVSSLNLIKIILSKLLVFQILNIIFYSLNRHLF